MAKEKCSIRWMDKAKRLCKIKDQIRICAVCLALGSGIGNLTISNGDIGRKISTDIEHGGLG